MHMGASARVNSRAYTCTHAHTLDAAVRSWLRFLLGRPQAPGCSQAMLGTLAPPPWGH